MPRNVRNFWIECSVDGSKKDIGTGPRNKDGGFSLIIKQRDKGGIVNALHVDGRVLSDGTLILEASAQGAGPGELDQQIQVRTRR